MHKRTKGILSLGMVICLSFSSFNSYPVQAATNVYVQTTDSDTGKLETPSIVYEVNNIGQEDYDSVQNSGEMIYVNHDKIKANENVAESSSYQLETIRYYSDNASDFFNDCSSNYWFSKLENYSAAKDYQTLYMNILDLLKSNYESEEDVSPMDFDGTSYYCIGTLDYASLGIGSSDLFTIYNYVLYDHPLLFNCKRTIIYDGMYVYLIAAEEFYQGTTRQLYRTNLENAIKDFETLTQDAATNFDIVNIVHDEVVQTLEYGYEDDGVTPLNNGYVHSPAGYVHTEKLAVCDGYTCMIQAILSYLDIENYFVPGTGVDAAADVKHAWNLVALGNGKHYFVDATWDDTAGEGLEEEYLCFGYNTYATTHHTSALSVSGFNIPKGDYYTMEYGEWVIKNPDTGIVKASDPTYSIIDTCDYVFEDGVLTFSGKGKVVNVETDNPDSNPWQQYKDSVTKIVFNDGITGMDYGIFRGYQNLREIDFGNTVVFLGDGAFGDCVSLEEVALPDNVTYYGAGVFDGCTNLTTISIGATPTNGSVVYGSPLFIRNPKLQTIRVSENNVIFESVDNVLYDKTRKVLLTYPEGCTNASYTIKEGTEKIMRMAFSDNDDLEEIHFPDSLKVVDISSFYVMEKLDNVTFPASVEYFYNVNIPSEKTDGVFTFCCSLKTVTNQSEAVCYLSSGSIKDDTSISGNRTGYWYSTTQNKYVTEIQNETAVLKVIEKPTREGSTFELNGVTYKVTSWKEGLEDVYDIIGYSGISYATRIVDAMNNLEETAGYVTVVTESEIPSVTCRFPDAISYQYWNYIVDKESLSFTHELTKTEKKDATCTEAGKYAYWTCSDCSKIFTDAEGTREVTDESTLIIAPTEHAWNDEYMVDKEPTETETGSKSIHCKDCGVMKEGSSVVIPVIEPNDTETPPQGGDEEQDTEAPPQGGDGTQDTETPPQGGDGTQDTETPPQGGDEEQDTETPPQGGDGTQDTETPPQGGDGTQDTETPPQGGDGTQDTEAPPQGGDGTQDTETPPQSGDNITDTEKTPQKGDTITDTETNAVYMVTKAEEKTGNVIYIRSTDSKAVKVEIPATIQIAGVTYKVTAITDNAFKNNKKITSVIIGSNVTEIGKNAFSGCKKLKTVTIGKSVTAIRDKAFSKCTKLTTITIPAKVKKIGANVFKGCTKLKRITIKSKLLKEKKISKNAFKGVSTKAIIIVQKKKLKSYKKLLQSKGLNKKVKIKRN